MALSTPAGQRRGRGQPGLRSVLVATDLSPGASRAVERVPHLPLAERARILLVTVGPAGRGGGQDTELWDRLTRATDELARQVRSVVPGVRVEPILLHGSPHEQLAACGATARVDLILLGRHGRRPLADLFGLGTTADRLIRVSETPVVVARSRARAPYRRLLVALDRPPAAATRRAIRTARRLADRGAEWTAVHVADDLHASAMRKHRFPRGQVAEYYHSEEARLRREIAGDLRRAFPDLKCTVAIEWGEPRFLVPDAAVKHRADLIVVGARTRRSLDRRLLGTVAESVLRRAQTDVLIAPAPAGRTERG